MPAAPARSQQASAARAMAGSHPGWVRADRGRARSLPTPAGSEQATGRACRDVERHDRPAGSQPLHHPRRAGVAGRPVTGLTIGVEAPALGQLIGVECAARRAEAAEADRGAVGGKGTTAGAVVAAMVSAEDTSARAVAATATLTRRRVRRGGCAPEWVARMSLTPV